MLKASILAALAAAAGLIAASHMAEAKHRHHRHHHYFLYAAPYVAPAYDCAWAYARWASTGSAYWKKRYFICKGWW